MNEHTTHEEHHEQQKLKAPSEPGDISVTYEWQEWERQERGRAVRAELDLLTEEDLAAALNVKVETLAQWRARKYGPSWTKLGKGVYYRLESVVEWTMDNERHLVEGEEHEPDQPELPFENSHHHHHHHPSADERDAIAHDQRNCAIPEIVG